MAPRVDAAVRHANVNITGRRRFVGQKSQTRNKPSQRVKTKPLKISLLQLTCTNRSISESSTNIVYIRYTLCFNRRFTVYLFVQDARNNHGTRQDEESHYPGLTFLAASHGGVTQITQYSAIVTKKILSPSSH